MKLVTRADDAGSFPAANRAILDSVRRGICRNVGIMAVGPALTQAVEIFRDEPNICLGLHAAINSEWHNTGWSPVLPAGKVPSLVAENGFCKHTPNDNFSSGIVYEQIVMEIKAQIDALRKLKLPIVYMDTHMVFGWMHAPDQPNHRVEDDLAALAAREGLLYFKYDWSAARSRPSIGDTVLTSVRPGPGDPIDATCAALQALKNESHSLIVCHPAEPDAQMQQVALPGGTPGQVAQERYHDWQRFVDPRILACCRENAITPVRVDKL